MESLQESEKHENYERKATNGWINLYQKKENSWNRI